MPHAPVTIKLWRSAIGALVRISVRRVYLSMSSACPDQDLFRLAWDRLRPT